MQKIKYSTIVLITSVVLFFLLCPELIPENFQPQEVLDEVASNDVIIIFNSGGWGNTPLEEAEDLTPIIEGIQETLDEWGYNSVVIPYNRTKDDFLGKVSGTKAIFNSFQIASGDLAERVEAIAKEAPGKKIIIAGLSNGGSFVSKTYEKISEEVKGSVYAIAVGVPFWTKLDQSDNVLSLNNNGKDGLAGGNVKELGLALVKAPLKWLSARIRGDDLSFGQAIHISNHDYSWSSPEINHQVITFLEDKFH